MKHQNFTYLANEGVIAFEFGITPRGEVEIYNGEKLLVFKELNKIIDDKIGTVGTKRFIV